MPKPGELNWDELYKSEDSSYSHEPSALWAADQYGGGKHGVDPLNKAKPVNAPGEVPRKPTDDEIASYILKGADAQGVGQWRDEDHLHKEVVSQEEAEQLQKSWENVFNDHFAQLDKPVEDQLSKDNQEWGSGKSFNDSLTEEERLRRNMFTGE